MTTIITLADWLFIIFVGILLFLFMVAKFVEWGKKKIGKHYIRQGNTISSTETCCDPKYCKDVACDFPNCSIDCNDFSSEAEADAHQKTLERQGHLVERWNQ